MFPAVHMDIRLWHGLLGLLSTSKHSLAGMLHALVKEQIDKVYTEKKGCAPGEIPK